MYAPIYDAVTRFFAQCQWRGKPLLTVFAAPDRAVEEANRIVSRRSGKKRKAISDKSGPVPFQAVWITPPKFDRERYNPTYAPVEADLQTGNAKIARFPWPFQADVQLDLSCGSRSGERIAEVIEPQVNLRFYGGDRTLPINWADPKWYEPPFDVLRHAQYMGQTRITLHEEGWQDTSDLEAGEGAKQIRRTWSGRVTGYVPYMPEEARLVMSVSVEVRDAINDELLGELVLEE